MSEELSEERSEPLIFSVQHLCLHDGPGIRSVVFFKGCPLHCTWCQNPESWSKEPELGFKAHLCINCRTCVDICPHGAMTSAGMWDRERCRLCFSCVESCPSGALTRFGVSRSIESLFEELRHEFPLYRNSNGGVTFSGGEPTLFPGFAARLASLLHHHGIHLALETCGQFSLEKHGRVRGQPQSSKERPVDSAWSLLSEVDLVLFDLKIFDPGEHSRQCGAGNTRIRNNLVTMAERARNNAGPAVWPRLPLIPGITDTKENLLGWSGLLCRAGLENLTLVPYHRLGDSKRTWLGMEPGPDLLPVTDEAVSTAREVFAQQGITCFSPGEEAW